jgi:hypothetical protein
MAGYDVSGDLAAHVAVEPAAGEGDFLVPMALRLLRSTRLKGRGPVECKASLSAYEPDSGSATVARGAVTQALVRKAIPEAEAMTLGSSWVRVGNYLTEAAGLPRADFVISNLPYVRLEDVPVDLARLS